MAVGGEGDIRVRRYKTKYFGEVEISAEEGDGDLGCFDAVYNGQEITFFFHEFSLFTTDELKMCLAIIDNYENINAIARSAITLHYSDNEDLRDYFEYIFENYEKDELLEIFGTAKL